MKEILEFLHKAGVFYLATTDGDQPHVRPMGFVMDYNGKLALCTNNKKAMCKQMVANPKVEISCFDGKGKTLRICGKVAFATNAATQAKALEIMPALKKIYSVGDGVFEIFYLDEAKAVCAGLGGKPQEVAI